MILEFLKYTFNKKKIRTLKGSEINSGVKKAFSTISTINDFKITNLIAQLKKDNTIVKVNDLGAGSKKTKSNNRTISSIANSAIVKPKYGRLLNAIIQSFKCETIIELGTSLGVGTAYLALNNTKSNVFTIEGCPNISKIAKHNINTLKLNNINFYTGDFMSVLPKILLMSGKADLVYIDGNHTYKATIEYFNFFIKNASENAILVFDDIYWSKEMSKAWAEIKASNKTKCTIDLFKIGIVFLGKSNENKNVVISF